MVEIVVEDRNFRRTGLPIDCYMQVCSALLFYNDEEFQFQVNSAICIEYFHKKTGPSFVLLSIFDEDDAFRPPAPKSFEVITASPKSFEVITTSRSSTEIPASPKTTIPFWMAKPKNTVD